MEFILLLYIKLTWHFLQMKNFKLLFLYLYANTWSNLQTSWKLLFYMTLMSLLIFLKTYSIKDFSYAKDTSMIFHFCPYFGTVFLSNKILIMIFLWLVFFLFIFVDWQGQNNSCINISRRIRHVYIFYNFGILSDVTWNISFKGLRQKNKF